MGSNLDQPSDDPLFEQARLLGDLQHEYAEAIQASSLASRTGEWGGEGEILVPARHFGLDGAEQLLVARHQTVAGVLGALGMAADYCLVGLRNLDGSVSAAPNFTDSDATMIDGMLRELERLKYEGGLPNLRPTLDSLNESWIGKGY